jgi:hypothetical protein
MECRISVRHHYVQLLTLVVVMLIPQVSWAERAVVLVTDKDSPIDEMTTLDIRKAYLGLAVMIDGRSVRALRMRNDERLNQIFMQSVIAMSLRSYERRLLSLALKYGRPRPTEVGGPEELSKMIVENSPSIGYMWRSDAESDSRVKIIKVLWQEP